MIRKLSKQDHDKVSVAVTAAEASSSGEIVVVATPISDAYHDVALHWALVPLFAVLAWAAWRPTALAWWHDLLFGGWQPEPTQSQLFTLLMFFAALKFTIALLILKWMPLRLFLTPAATKHRRVRRRAIAIFQAAAAGRTTGRTGILIYLSLAERRAEIVADQAILEVTDDQSWGEAMTDLLTNVRAGRIGDGIVAAVNRVGAVLSEHFPRSAADLNEIPDELIEL
ncbi:MAG: TPM domain-containing protein [Sphingomicrobium sp.]